MFMTYIDPKSVNSPKQRWVLLDVLRDSGEGADSLSVGMWDKKKVLAMRWNGDKSNRLGNPQSRGIPTWFVIPECYYEAILSTLPKDVEQRAKVYLGI